jgi:hypothetical protein
MSEIEININQMARVKLTSYGIEIYRRQMIAINKTLPDDLKIGIHPRLDSDGYYRAELWRIMQEFGSAIGPASEQPFSTTIFIEE